MPIEIVDGLTPEFLDDNLLGLDGSGSGNTGHVVTSR